MAEKGIKIIAPNKKAYHDYFVLEKYEAGISLAGTEVKSVRGGHVNLKDSYVSIEDGEMFVHGMHISPYEKGNIFNKEPLRQSCAGSLSFNSPLGRAFRVEMVI